MKKVIAILVIVLFVGTLVAPAMQVFSSSNVVLVKGDDPNDKKQDDKSTTTTDKKCTEKKDAKCDGKKDEKKDCATKCTGEKKAACCSAEKKTEK